MTKQEIFEFASQPTYVWNRTLLHFKNGTFISGFFNGTFKAMDKDAPNEWGFICLPKEADKETITVINGDDLEKIEIIVWQELKNKLNSQ